MKTINSSPKSIHITPTDNGGFIVEVRHLCSIKSIMITDEETHVFTSARAAFAYVKKVLK